MRAGEGRVARAAGSQRVLSHQRRAALRHRHAGRREHRGRVRGQGRRGVARGGRAADRRRAGRGAHRLGAPLRPHAAARRRAHAGRSLLAAFRRAHDRPASGKGRFVDRRGAAGRAHAPDGGGAARAGGRREPPHSGGRAHSLLVSGRKGAGDASPAQAAGGEGACTRGADRRQGVLRLRRHASVERRADRACEDHRRAPEPGKAAADVRVRHARVPVFPKNVRRCHGGGGRAVHGLGKPAGEGGCAERAREGRGVSPEPRAARAGAGGAGRAAPRRGDCRQPARRDACLRRSPRGRAARRRVGAD